MSAQIPVPTSENKKFWDACQNEQLIYQECNECFSVQFIPHTVCTNCHSRNLKWKESKKTGQVMTYTKVYRAPTNFFAKLAPYTIVLVELNEGFRLMVNCANAIAENIKIGEIVNIDFKNIDGYKIPYIGKDSHE